MPFEFCNVQPPKRLDDAETSRCELPKGHEGPHAFRKRGFFGWVAYAKSADEEDADVGTA